MPTTRHLCPLPGCGWYHDEPNVAADDVLRVGPAPSAATLNEAIASMVEMALLGRAARVEALIEAHVSNHPVLDWLREVSRLQQIVRDLGFDPMAPATSDGEEPPC